MSFPFCLRRGAAVLALLCTASATFAAPASVPPKRKPLVKSAKAVKPAKPVEQPLAAASAEQIEAAERVYYGVYDCEFKQSVDITADPKYPAYVDVRHGKELYVMKPVLSSTGAVRLEDVKGATLMVQISNKSMLLDVKAGKRLVDDCVSPKQRELIEAARQARAADAAAAGASAAEAASAAAK